MWYGRPGNLKGLRARLALAGAIVALTALANCKAQVSTAAIQVVAPSTLAKWIRSKPSRYLVVDVRRADEFAGGRVRGARRFDLPEIDPDHSAGRWTGYSAIVVYGRTPGSLRAEAITKRFMRIDAAPVYLLDGGFDAWQRAGLPEDGPDPTDQ